MFLNLSILIFTGEQRKNGVLLLPVKIMVRAVRGSMLRYALLPRDKGVIAKSFARIHLANLINFGIIPLTFKNAEDYNRIDPDDELQIRTADLDNGDSVLKNLTKGVEIPVQHAMTSSEVLRIKAGGTLAYISRQNM